MLLQRKLRLRTRHRARRARKKRFGRDLFRSILKAPPKETPPTTSQSNPTFYKMETFNKGNRSPGGSRGGAITKKVWKRRIAQKKAPVKVVRRAEYRGIGRERNGAEQKKKGKKNSGGRSIEAKRRCAGRRWDERLREYLLST